MHVEPAGAGRLQASRVDHRVVAGIDDERVIAIGDDRALVDQGEVTIAEDLMEIGW